MSAPTTTTPQCALKGTTLSLVADPTVNCFGVSYSNMFFFSYIAIGMYGFGVPSMFCYIIIRNRYVCGGDMGGELCCGRYDCVCVP